MRKKGRFMLSIILVGLLLLSELFIWSSGRIGLINTVSRMISDAPDIAIQGKRLSYQGTVSFEDTLSFEQYASSDEGKALYKAKGTPIPPPWIYVKKDENHFFRYKVPQIPWRM
ncbi:hypothetical protein ABIC22_003265 [Paenibacillus sp. PvP094]|uniref:hypothetical protein n=1 Tax=Paenibacillus sp. PvP094 TaxID=3156394 RepID=UPI0033963BF6